MKKIVFLVLFSALVLPSCSEPQGEVGRVTVTLNAPPRFIAHKSGPITTVVNGIIEINTGQRTSCLSLPGLSFEEASITGRNAAVGPFSPANGRGGDICLRDLDADLLSNILTDPSSYSFDLELPSGETVTADLKPLA